MTAAKSQAIDRGSFPRPKIDLIATRIAGCFELRPVVVDDRRGFFAKIFHRPLWEDFGLWTDFAEEYVTHSVSGTLRGLHFQTPPMDHHKVVTCLRGSAWDVAVDLRAASPTFGEHISVHLSDSLANALYRPAGVAHRFCVTGAEALFYYKVSTVDSPEHDAGIHWDSAGIRWPISDPVLSGRDQKLQPFASRQKPFTLSRSKVAG